MEAEQTARLTWTENNRAVLCRTRGQPSLTQGDQASRSTRDRTVVSYGTSAQPKSMASRVNEKVRHKQPVGRGARGLSVPTPGPHRVGVKEGQKGQGREQRPGCRSLRALLSSASSPRRVPHGFPAETFTAADDRPTWL